MRKLPFLFGILTIIVMLSIFEYSAAAANFDTKSIEKLVKKTETQAAGISKHIDIYEPEEIKFIPAKTIENLRASIKKAKDGLKNYKGNAKKNFVQRIESSEYILQKGKIFNNTITKGAILLKDLRTFQSKFNANPFLSEKALFELAKKNDLYTKEKKKLLNASAIEAFSLKYQAKVENELNQGTTFYETNKRLDNFISFSSKNKNGAVWNEIFSIDYEIQKSISNPYYRKLLAEKWDAIFYPAFIAPEKENIEQFFQEYVSAFNFRDAIAVAEFYYFVTEKEKNAFIESLAVSFTTLPSTVLKEPLQLDLRFVYEDTAILFFSESASIVADHDELVPSIILVKINDKWLFLDSGDV